MPAPGAAFVPQVDLPAVISNDERDHIIFSSRLFRSGVKQRADARGPVLPCGFPCKHGFIGKPRLHVRQSVIRLRQMRRKGADEITNGSLRGAVIPQQRSGRTPLFHTFGDLVNHGITHKGNSGAQPFQRRGVRTETRGVRPEREMEYVRKALFPKRIDIVAIPGKNCHPGAGQSPVQVQNQMRIIHKP